MKNLFFLLLCIPVISFLIGCEAAGSGDGSGTSTSFQKTWSVSGTIDFSGCDTSGEPDIKMAAFFVGNDISAEPGDPIVSNIVNLGNSQTESTITFSLDIDAASLNPVFGDEILIVSWQDSDSDNLLDSGEWDETTQANTGCPVFSDDASCSFWYSDSEYFGAQKGWNIDPDDQINDDYIPITAANSTLTGADIRDDIVYPW